MEISFNHVFNSLVIAFVICFPIFLISNYIAVLNPKRKEKLMQKLIKEGNVVTAVLKKVSRSHIDVPGTHSNFAHLVTYEYEWNGKKYKYRYWSSWNNPSSTTKLYFFKNPRKAKPEGRITEVKFSWKLFLVITFLSYLILSI